jgi:PAS domain S-box-containing protein
VLTLTSLFGVFLVITLAVLTAIYRRMREIEATQAQLRGILGSAQDGISVVDSRGRLLVVNQHVARLLGYEPAEVSGLPLARLLSDGSRAHFDLKPILQSPEKVATRRLNALGKDGATIPVDVRFFPVKGPDGPLAGVVFRDMRERLRSEELLQVRERAMESVSQGILVVDLVAAHHPISYANPALERLLKSDHRTLLGENWACVLPEEHRVDVSREIELALTEGRSYLVELGGRRQDGTAFSWTLTALPVRDAAGTITRFVGLVTDVSEQKKLEAQLLQAQKMEAIGRLAGGVAHDFNNLLTVILGHSEMLLGVGPGANQHRLNIEMIRDAAEKAAALTKQLLAFGRKQMLTPVVVNLSDLVTDMEQMLRRLIPADIELAMDCDRDVHAVKLDANQMGQVLMNLIVNARDAIGSQGRIAITTANVDAPMEVNCPEMPHGSYVLLRISDNGCGMDDDVRAHAFEPFYTTKEAGHGTGLGLATVYGIVKQSGGFIYVHSTPGKGTRFDIYFPRVHESLSSVLGKRKTDRLAERKTGTILLAEDEDGVRAVTGQILQAAGYTVLSARDGAEGERIG